MFTNPAADVQQPVGDAIVVANRVAPTGAMVTIRLADWFTGFYTFTNMTDWFDKIGQTVSRKQAASLTNIYGYEIWNEPGGTWASTNPLPFDQFWMQTFAQLRKLDPGTKIVGPSLSFLDMSFMQTFLTFCKANACLPDIVSWHELSGANLTGDIQGYRALEKQLGIGPLPISINEYSGAGHVDVEGQPGASAPLIAKFERFRVDSACISFWDVGHPGRMGSLLATSTAPNGGWWFYKWYGDMTGDMVSVTPPTPNSPTALDGFANLDAAGGTASVLVGGANDGAVQIVVTGFRAAPFFGSTVHTEVDHTAFVSRTTAVTATDTVSTGDVAIAGDRITVTIANANPTDGYRVLLTQVGGTGGSDGGMASDAGDGSPGIDRDAEVLNEAGAAADASASFDGASGSAEGGTGRAGDERDAMVGHQDASAVSTGPTGSTPAGTSSGCSCRVGSASSAIPALVDLALVPLLVLRGARRVSKRRT
jgi:hypothetical protein